MNFLYQSNEIIADRYVILNKLGQGGTAITYAAQDLSTNEQVAIKVLSLRKLDNWKKVELFEREAKILKQLNHGAIPEYIDYLQIETEDDNLFYIVQELAPGKSLATLIEEGWQPDEKTVRQIAEQVLEILIYLQQLVPPVIHRDIKPQNLICNEEGEIYLVDFGAVQDTYHHTVVGSTVVGTYGYMAPEQFRGQAFLATDLYGLATTLLFLLTHKSPAELPQRKLKINFRDSIKTSPEFADWLDQLLEPNYQDRLPSAEVALAVLQSRESLNNYIKQKPPIYTSVSLTKTEEKLVITIPPALFYQQRDRVLLVYTLAWYAALFLIILAVSSSVPTTNILLLIYIFCFVIQIFVVDSYGKIFRFIQLLLLSVSLPILSICFFFGMVSNGVITSYFLLCIESLWLTASRISLIRNIIFTTRLQLSKEGEIKISRKFFKLNLVDIDYEQISLQVSNSINFLWVSVIFPAKKHKTKNYKCGGLLTAPEKSWLAKQINQWLVLD